MHKQATLFGGIALLGSAAGFLLRTVELNTLLDRRTMLMDFGAVSVILMAVAALSAILFLLLARSRAEAPGSYAQVFRSAGNLTVSVVCFFGLLLGAVIGLREWQASGRVLRAVTALLAALAGCGWLSLSVDAQRRKKGGCSLLAAAAPVVFGALLLIAFYKTYAPIPALRYNLYPFLALCADLLAVHLLAGYTAERVRPRLTMAVAGIGVVLSITALPGVEETEYRLYFAVFALQLFAHGVRMLLPRDEAPEIPKSEPALRNDTDGAEAPSDAAVSPAEAETADAPEANAEIPDTPFTDESAE